MLKEMTFFKTMKPSQLEKLADALQEQTYISSEYIVRQGERGDTFFVIFSGEVEVTQSMESVEFDGLSARMTSTRHKKLREMGPGEYFGEKALLGDDGVRTANIICKTDVTCLTLSKQIFDRLIGSRFTADSRAGVKTSVGYMRNSQQYMRTQSGTLNTEKLLVSGVLC